MFRRILSNLLRPIQRQQQRNMKVLVDRVLADNYMYYIIDEDSKNKEAFVVDLGDASKVPEIEKQHELEIKGALITHHHLDHSAGAHEFSKKYPDAQIYAMDKERIPELTSEVTDKQVIEWNSINIECISTPGHTTSHVCFYVKDTKNDQTALFTGDTIFLAGCGKFFECKGSVMYKTIENLMERVDNDADMYFGHEYSLTNLKFAHTVDPTNKHVTEKLDKVKQLVRDNKPTAPSKWSEEKTYNPFLRVKETAIKEFAKLSDPVEVLDKIREAKNNFKV